MDLIEDDCVVENLAAAASDPAFANSILPRTSIANPFWLNAAGNQEIRYLCAEL